MYQYRDKNHQSAASYNSIYINYPVLLIGRGSDNDRRRWRNLYLGTRHRPERDHRNKCQRIANRTDNIYCNGCYRGRMYEHSNNNCNL